MKMNTFSFGPSDVGIKVEYLAACREGGRARRVQRIPRGKTPHLSRCGVLPLGTFIVTIEPMVIDGKKIAEELLGELKKKPRIKKFLAGILIGNDPASLSFLMHKQKAAEELGVDFRLYRLAAELGNDKLREEVGKIAGHRTCGGALVELPLPAPLNRHYILNAVPREKDVDVLGERALGAFYADRNPIAPPVAETTAEILRRMNFELKGKKAAIVGTGFLIGRPIVTWLMNKVEEIYVVHRGSALSILKKADLVILGTGHPHLVAPEMVKDGALVIDFGYGKINGKICGDFDDDALKISNFKFQISYTPVPGGAGPILIAKLFENFYTLVGLQK